MGLRQVGRRKEGGQATTTNPARKEGEGRQIHKAMPGILPLMCTENVQYENALSHVTQCTASP